MNRHPQLMNAILQSKSFEHTRKLYIRSTALAFPVIVDISKLSRYTQRNSFVSSNKHNHNRYNPKQHIQFHTASASFPFQYVHPYILWIPTLYSLHELLNQYPLNPKTQLSQPPFPLHTKRSTSHRQSDPIPQRRKNPFIHIPIVISTQLSTPHNQHLPSPSSLVFHVPYYLTTSNTTHQTSRNTYF